MRHRHALLLVLVAGATAAAGPGEDRIITDEELLPHYKEYAKLVEEIQAGRLKPGDLVQRYAQRKLARNISTRERAIRTFMYATVVRDAGKDFKTSRRSFEEAIKVWPDFPAAYIGLAAIAARADDVGAVKRFLTKALAVDPDYVEAIIHLGRIALQEKDLDEAEQQFKQSTEVKLTEQAFMGLRDVYTRRWKAAVTDEQREKWARKAIGAAKAHVDFAPKVGLAHVFRAKAYKDLGMLGKAIDALEDSFANYGLEDKWRLEILMSLLDLYQRRADVVNVRRTIERLLKMEGINAAQRERLEQMLKDIKDKGPASFAIWTIDGLIAILQNELISVGTRVRALNQLLEILEQPEITHLPELRPKAREIFRAVFRVLVDAPADVAAATLRWMRQHIQDPNLTRILVHFVYPYDDEKRSPDVRVAAVRALDASCGEAALPALLFCLSDADGRVVREVDKALARVCERRSLVGGGIAPLTDDEIRTARQEWLDYRHSDEGAERLARAYVQLAAVVSGDESRGQRSAPMVDHAVKIVLLDNDVKWPAWKAAYEFLLKYWGKDFRPPEARDRPVAPSDRAAIVSELEPFWDNSRPDDEADVVAPDEKPDAKRGERNARFPEEPATRDEEGG